MFDRIRHHLCKHVFKKHYDAKAKCYIYHCAKCGKVVR